MSDDGRPDTNDPPQAEKNEGTHKPAQAELYDEMKILIRTNAAFTKEIIALKREHSPLEKPRQTFVAKTSIYVRKRMNYSNRTPISQYSSAT
jgi:hypothetical protein